MMTLKTLWTGFQTIVVVAFLVFFLLSRVRGKYPHVAWLQAFKIEDRRTEEQKRKARHTRQILDGMEMIVMGLVLVPLYLLSNVLMFFSTPNPAILTLTGVGSVVLIAFGIRTIVKARSA
jgi:hypothetical protein